MHLTEPAQLKFEKSAEWNKGKNSLRPVTGNVRTIALFHLVLLVVKLNARL